MARVKRPKKEAAKAISNTELLDMAKGVTPLVSNKVWDKKPGSVKDFLLYRREARRAVYKILKCKKFNRPIEDDPALVEMFELLNPQINPNFGITWGSFTVNWDIHPQDVTKIVIKEHWLKEGGGFDTDFGTHYPVAFTNQEK